MAIFIPMRHFLFCMLILTGPLLQAQVTVDSWELQEEKGTFRYQGQPFTGTAQKWEIQGATEEKRGHLVGILTFEKGHAQRETSLLYHHSSGVKTGEENHLFTETGKVADGIWRQWYANGRLRSQSVYENGRLEGLQELWYPEGNKQGEIHYKNGVKDGISTFWNEYGRKSGEIPYQNGQIHGTKRSWNKEGILTMEVDYGEDKLNGRRRIWYETGELRSEENFQEGILEGQAKYYFLNGNLEMAGNYHLGEKDGYWEHFYENGLKDAAGNYRANDRWGEWSLWTCSGQLVKVKYEAGLAKTPLPHGVEELEIEQISGLKKGQIKVEGRVFKKKTCDVLEGISLFLQDVEDNLLDKTLSDAEGRYAFDFDPKKGYRISTAGQPYEAVMVFDFRAEPGHKMGLNFFLKEPGCGKE
ncbi:MAG: toxin-antitoxin system YwqK family antitoxin [Bacteroidia bacterium]|nr:toxin-antitoxin system YwqK family antitoxin [Bacteroidia bacterium]